MKARNDDSPAQGAFRAQVRGFLHQHLPDGWIEALDGGDDAAFEEARSRWNMGAWMRLLGESGYAAPLLPREYGGLGVGPVEQGIIREELSAHRLPLVSANLLGVAMAAPTIVEHGTEEQRQRHVRPILVGDEIWCQLFSEPGSGSDVAGLSTRAERDGDEWVVNGQKVWTTLAHLSKWGMLVARTDPDQPKHRGLTYFALDMSTPGVEVRPLRQLTGDAEFNEVYFTDVRIPDSMRIGEVGRGWDVAITTLMNERVALGGGGGAGFDSGAVSPVDLLMTLARKTGAAIDPVARQRLAQLYIEARVLRYTNQRSQASLQAGKMPGPEGSIGKLLQAEWNQRVQETMIDVLGSYGLARFGPSSRQGSMPGLPVREGAVSGVGHDADSAQFDTTDTIHTFLRSRANTIEGGTSEIMRNILGERILGLPGEPRADKDMPWSKVPRS